MQFLAEPKHLLFAPIVHLSAGRLTAATLLHRRGVDDSTRFAVTKIVRYAISLVGFIIAVDSIGLKLDALLTASAALFVGIGFGLQTIAQNFISGLILLIERPVGKGDDFVQIGNVSGVVFDIGLRATLLVIQPEVAS